MNAFSNVEPNTHLPFFLLLAFIGGFVDASSFVIFEVFTGHLTGNSVLSMIYLAQMNWAMLLLSAISILGFFLGTLTGSWFRMKKTSPSQHSYVISLVFILFAIVFSLHFFAPSAYSINLAIFMISLSMGIQNGYFNKAGSIGIHTTYVTGMTTSCIGAFLKNVEGDKSKKVLLCAVLSFIFGALAGGYLSVNYHLAGFSCVLILLFSAIIYSVQFKQ
ncbi:YoaK family protein [Providencia burhodogranariea]|uniref:DUF1275 domain-containing protein n=1 Tax=Providencia burhodogranariea DSM 19968 TaxID=1141662 RepID=K8W1H4_9GAMM|nr:YoaK family protein [Providencia burhodogranariea]EKT53676.1 hypothetical protein OOA_18424 [Providencia burhodogranariea DSM 19968]